MKKFKWLLWIMFAGIALYTLAFLNGFGGETIPKNRTKEQYKFEKTFEPMFKFLEQDKKEFNGLEAYRSRVYIENGDEVNRYLVDLDINQSDIKGDYTINTEGNKEKVPVTYSNGKLNYSSEMTPLFDDEILNLVVKRDYFASLDVKETFKSAETDLRDIIYQPESQSELNKYLKNKYDMPEDTSCRVRLDCASGTIYSFSILMESKNKSVQIDLSIFKK